MHFHVIALAAWVCHVRACAERVGFLPPQDWFEEEERKTMDMDETNRIATILVYLSGAALSGTRENKCMTPKKFEYNSKEECARPHQCIQLLPRGMQRLVVSTKPELLVS